MGSSALTVADGAQIQLGITSTGSNIIAGDLDLPTLGAGLAWDVSAFTQYGVIVIVPEPSRVILLLLGLLSLMLRRRRR